MNMSSSSHGVKSVASFFMTVVDRMLGAEPPAPVADKRTQNLAQKRMNIRAVGVREGFQAMRARSEQMTHRIEEFKKHRHPSGDAAQASIDPIEPVETIILSSSPLQRRADSAAS
jgi:hypothetical protein